jgi:ankyrin repeat protein
MTGRNKNRQFVEELVKGFVSQGRAATALGEAARWGRMDLVEELLKTGLDVDERNEFGDTPLMLAASGGQNDVVGYLIERGADVNAVSGFKGATPLIYCVAALHRDRVYRAVIERLLKAGASGSLELRDATGRTALDWAKDGRPPEVIALIEGFMTV